MGTLSCVLLVSSQSRHEALCVHQADGTSDSANFDNLVVSKGDAYKFPGEILILSIHGN